MKNIVIFASGSGSNAESIMEYFRDSESIKINSIFTNRSDAGVIRRAQNRQIAFEVFSKTDFQDESFLKRLDSYAPSLIVLAGFLLKVPDYLVKAFPNRILNIHPSLLPQYGGKGMYGHHVHAAVFDNKETRSGMTIHYVNEHYDEGAIIYQESTDISDCTSPDEIAQKVLVLEHKNYPRVIEEVLQKI